MTPDFKVGITSKKRRTTSLPLKDTCEPSQNSMSPLPRLLNISNETSRTDCRIMKSEHFSISVLGFGSTQIRFVATEKSFIALRKNFVEFPAPTSTICAGLYLPTIAYKMRASPSEIKPLSQ